MLIGRSPPSNPFCEIAVFSYSGLRHDLMSETSKADFRKWMNFVTCIVTDEVVFA